MGLALAAAKHLHGHLLLSSSAGRKEKIGRIKVRRLVGQDIDHLISNEKRRKKPQGRLRKSLTAPQSDQCPGSLQRTITFGSWNPPSFSTPFFIAECDIVLNIPLASLVRLSQLCPLPSSWPPQHGKKRQPWGFASNSQNTGVLSTPFQPQIQNTAPDWLLGRQLNPSQPDSGHGAPIPENFPKTWTLVQSVLWTRLRSLITSDLLHDSHRPHNSLQCCSPLSLERASPLQSGSSNEIPQEHH